MHVPKPVLLLGCGGHAKVVAAMLSLNNATVLGVVDKHYSAEHIVFKGWDILGDDSIVENYPIQEIELANGIGFLPGAMSRIDVFNRFVDKGYPFVTIVHPQAIVAADVVLQQGVQVMAGAVIQPDAVIGENVIVNTGATVDHDCDIGASCHIAPGATLCGGVRLAENVFIGSGACVTQGVAIGANSVIGAGVVVTKERG